MTQDSAISIALLVLERGAEWPSWGTGLRMRAENSAVEVQTETETHSEFQERVLGRIAKIAREGMSLRAAGYACALDSQGRWDGRRAIFADLASALAEVEGAELILAGGAWGVRGREGQERGRLIEMWGELSLTVPGRLISVKFEDPPTESGIYRAAQQLRTVKEEATNTKPPPAPTN